MDELIRYMRALLLLQLSTVTQGSGAGGGAAVMTGKPEVLLARAGFGHREIGEMIGKTPTAVAKAISRAKQAKPGETELAVEALDE